MTWTADEVSAVNATLIPKGNSRQGPVNLPPSPHGALASGLADFREFRLTRASGVVITNADFTKARSPKNGYGADQLIQLAWVQCDRVVFDRARVFHAINGRFRDCSFRQIGTSGCGFTGTYTDCDFSGTSFRNAHLGANFVRCKFHDCNMKVAGWGSSFENCEFAGATIDDLFQDIREVALSAPAVTFVILTTGAVRPGETRHIS